jgi:uncharacterized protein with HEPN domain
MSYVDKHEPLIRLKAILDSIARIESYVAGVSEADFLGEIPVLSGM